MPAPTQQQLLAGVATVAAMGAGYIKQVSATRFPGKRQQRGHSEG